MVYQQEEDINSAAYEDQDESQVAELSKNEEEAGVAHLVQGWIQQNIIQRVGPFKPWFFF